VVAPSPPPSPSSSSTPCLRIVSVNDVYSLENLPRLRSLVRRYVEVEPASAVLVTLAGDFLAPSLLSSIDAGRGMVDCLDAVGVTHVVLGNHEDDLPPDELRGRLQELTAVCLGTNVRSGLDLPRHAVIDVAEGISVGLVGVVMADPTVYRGAPFGGVELVPANDAALEEARILIQGGCATVVPITHQSVADDRSLVTRSAATAPRFPVIVGGHEHSPILTQHDGTWIVKAGSEATHAVITELRWPDPTNAAEVVVTTQLEPVADYHEDREVRARVDMHMAKVHELARATLLRLAPGETLSSVGTRSRQTTIGTLLCSRLRDALEAEVCLFNGGGIRASRDYTERLTYGDIEAEVPFDNEIVVVSLRGDVIRDAIAASRALAPAESGAFLQVDDRTIVGPDHQLTALAGAPYDPARFYSVAVVRELLLGLDKVEPLARWGRESPALVPPPGSGREPKIVLVQAFAVAIWQALGGFDALDVNGDDRVTMSEVAAAVARAHPSEAPSPVLVDLVLRAVDSDADKVISRDDAASVPDTLRRR
jgi:2',3'-cyclic-nucleotide 2'-phosphodiesterase (5'-nucleotidase family)